MSDLIRGVAYGGLAIRREDGPGMTVVNLNEDSRYWLGMAEIFVQLLNSNCTSIMSFRAIDTHLAAIERNVTFDNLRSMTPAELDEECQKLMLHEFSASASIALGHRMQTISLKPTSETMQDNAWEWFLRRAIGQAEDKDSYGSFQIW